MGEEEKRPAEEKKMEEKKTEEVGKEEKKEEKKEEETKTEENKEEKKTEDSKEAPPPPPPPPQEIVLRVFMHCEGCARKVRRCLKGFEGVEDVQTDCKTHKVIVKGEKADPMKVLERVQRKSHRHVQLISPIPKPPADEPKKVEEDPKPEEKKPEPQVISVVLKFHMHCEACAQEIKKRIQRMKGVENVEADLKSSQVTVKGVFDPANLVEYVYKKTGKHGVIVKQDPPEKVAGGEDEKGKDGKEEKKGDEGEKEVKKGEDEGKKDAGEDAGKPDAAKEKEAPAPAPEEGMKVMEVKKNEFYYYYPQQQQYQVYPQRFAATEIYSPYPYPPQIFSDENPNACSVM